MSKKTRECWTLNSSLEITARITIPRAITLVVSEVATIYDAYEGEFFRSQHLVIPKPRYIVLNEYVFVDHQPYLFGVCSYSGVLERDGYRCNYCDRKASTIDHVFPVSRGGKTDWENCVAACFRCNQDKADRTPEEAGMRLLRYPYVPDQSDVRVKRSKERERAQSYVYQIA